MEVGCGLPVLAALTRPLRGHPLPLARARATREIAFRIASHFPDMVGPVKGWNFGFVRITRDVFSEAEEKSWAEWLATVDQPDIRGLVTDMT